MDAGLLEKLLGGNRTWSAPCVVLLDAEAAVRAPGPDTILGGGIKTYAPRYASGRLEADSCCLLRDENAILGVRQQTFKDGTGQEQFRQTLLIVALSHVVGLEFPHLNALAKLGVPAPFIPEDTEYRPGALVG